MVKPHLLLLAYRRVYFAVWLGLGTKPTWTPAGTSCAVKLGTRLWFGLKSDEDEDVTPSGP